MAGIRSKMGYKAIVKMKANKSKEVQFPLFSSLHKIGVVYERSIQEAATEIERFVSEMREAGKNVVELIYVPAKKLPLELSNELNRIFISKKHLDWRALPKKDAVVAFTREEFDCLFNFDTKGSLTLQAISAMSKARIRVAPFNPAFEFCHDLMLQNPENQPSNYISQIKHYFNFAS